MDEDVRFGKGIAWFGAAAGVAIALGLPTLLILYGLTLGAVAITILIALALIAGGILTTVSVFFGIVIPKGVS
jgi:hypothetical protein